MGLWVRRLKTIKMQDAIFHVYSIIILGLILNEQYQNVSVAQAAVIQYKSSSLKRRKRKKEFRPFLVDQRSRYLPTRYRRKYAQICDRWRVGRVVVTSQWVWLLPPCRRTLATNASCFYCGNSSLTATAVQSKWDEGNACVCKN